MLRALHLLWLVFCAVGLPLLGWWIAGWIVEEPPIVAPFLLASPLYAFLILGAVTWSKFMVNMETWKVPAQDEDLDELAVKYKDRLRAHLNRIALVSDDLLGQHVLPTHSWLFINRKVWLKLTKEGREFLLIRSLSKRKGAWSRHFAATLWFLGGYVLASVNLWFVLVVHGAAAARIALLTRVTGFEAEIERDRSALEIAGSLRGAIDYVKKTDLNEERQRIRIEALHGFAPSVRR